MIVGLSGYAFSGKDTVADILVDELGFRKASFADALRKCVEALDPIVEMRAGLRYSEIIDRYGYERAKSEFPEVRRILQRMGTEVGRNIMGDDIWVDLTMKAIDAEPNVDWVIADCRFPNEYSALSMRGIVGRIQRPGISAANAHVSETALDDFKFDFTLVNDGTIAELREGVLAYLRAYGTLFS